LGRGDVEVITGAATIVMLKLPELNPPRLSFTLMLAIVGPPAVVGVPDITPAALRLKPTGRAPPCNTQAYGATPFVAAMAWLYAAPTPPAGSGEVVVMLGGPAMVSVKFLVTPPPKASVSPTVKVVVPTAVGIPDNTPAPDRVNPAGKGPLCTDQV